MPVTRKKSNGQEINKVGKTVRTIVTKRKIDAPILPRINLWKAETSSVGRKGNP